MEMDGFGDRMQGFRQFARARALSVGSFGVRVGPMTEDDYRAPLQGGGGGGGGGELHCTVAMIIIMWIVLVRRRASKLHIVRPHPAGT